MTVKRKLSNLLDDFKIVEKELKLRFNNDEGLGLYSRSWCDNFYNKVNELYDKCNDLEEFKKGVKEIYN